MRIIGGTLGGRILHPPKGLPVRPTTDFAKTALFNILSSRLDFEEINNNEEFELNIEFCSKDTKDINLFIRIIDL